jgi:hypothetical protein
MAAEVIDGCIYENVTDLAEVNEVSNGEFLIVETQDGTRIINFENFLIGLDNVTFSETIASHTTNINSLSSEIDSSNSQITTIKGALNGIMTVGYTLSGADDGVNFSTTGYTLPLNYIQSNSIDGNLQNGNTTLNGVTSGSNAVNLNAGSYQVTFKAGFSGNPVVVDLYDNTNNQVLLTSDYSETPTIQGIITLQERSALLFRANTHDTTYLGVRTPFYVAGLWNTPLVASFQYLSSGYFNTNQPDTRT